MRLNFSHSDPASLRQGCACWLSCCMSSRGVNPAVQAKREFSCVKIMDHANQVHPVRK